jgi:hypothetical protein
MGGVNEDVTCQISRENEFEMVTFCDPGKNYRWLEHRFRCTSNGLFHLQETFHPLPVMFVCERRRECQRRLRLPERGLNKIEES